MSHHTSYSSCGSTKASHHSGSHCPSKNMSSVRLGSSFANHKNSSGFSQGGNFSSTSLHGISKNQHSYSSAAQGNSHGGISRNHKSSTRSGHALLSFNEKETMHGLNVRLATYLERVHSLEQENAGLERRICEWYANNAPNSLPDASQFFREIQELQSQVVSTAVDRASITLQTDNAQQAADGLRNKHESEANLRNNVEADVGNLGRVFGNLNNELQGLAGEVQCLQQELAQMKNNHAVEVNALRAQLGTRVNVEMNAAPSVDLNRVLSEVREEYENLMERNLRDVEGMFFARSAELDQEVSSGAAQLQSVNNELIDLKRSAQTLEIELESQLQLRSALQGTLSETEATYSSQLSQLQCMINNIEAQLSQIRSDIEQQNCEYQILMDQKTHLEMEISTYRQLLDRHDIQPSVLFHSKNRTDKNGNINNAIITHAGRC
uniref:IF rod domain-containing protein n=1 Tax=Leptobrachium leishanense TaxID=445787 RepID=A0A8C5WIN2_9ANUR